MTRCWHETHDPGYKKLDFLTNKEKARLQRLEKSTSADILWLVKLVWDLYGEAHAWLREAELP